MISQQKILTQIVEKYGHDHQMLKAVEECSELAAALLHYRDGRISAQAVAAEVADVWIMVSQLLIMLGPELIREQVADKLARMQPVLPREQDSGKPVPPTLGSLLRELTRLCELEEFYFQESPQYDWHTITLDAENCYAEICDILNRASGPQRIMDRESSEAAAALYASLLQGSHPQNRVTPLAAKVLLRLLNTGCAAETTGRAAD